MKAKPLSGFRFGVFWRVLGHDPEHTPETAGLATGRPVENRDRLSAGDDLTGPPTLNSIPLRAVEWAPEDDEPFSVIDLLRSSKPLAKCSTLAEAEAAARLPDRKVS